MPLCSDVRQAIMQAMECASTDETRVILNGAYLDLSDRNCQQIVATDGRHLYSSNSFSLPLKAFPPDPGPQIPGMAGIQQRWGVATAGAAGSEGRTGDAADQQPALDVSSARQIEGNYPNWRQVVPAPEPVQHHGAVAAGVHGVGARADPEDSLPRSRSIKPSG